MDAGILKGEGEGGGGRGKSSQLLKSLTMIAFDDWKIGGGGGGKNSGSSIFFTTSGFFFGGVGSFCCLLTLASSMAAMTVEAFLRKSEFSALMLRRSTDSFSKSVAL